MNNRFLKLAGVLALLSLFSSMQNLDAGPARRIRQIVQNSAQDSFVYTNSLTQSNQVITDFTDYSTIDSDYINTVSGGSFQVDTNYGLELLSTAPNYVDGIGAYTTLLSASKDWTISIQSHISTFTNSQTNPSYSAGISLVKTSAGGLEYPNRIELNLCRTGGTGTTLSNSIVSSLFINNGETDASIGKNLSDAQLLIRYKASSQTVTTAYSTNGSNYSVIQSYSLVSSWNLQPTDNLTLVIIANDQPEGRSIPTYSVSTGQIYLKNLTLKSPNAPTNAPQNTSTGGTLSGSGGSQNVYYGGFTINNGGLTFSGGTGTLSLGGGSLTIGTGTLVINTNGNVIGFGSLSNTYTGPTNFNTFTNGTTNGINFGGGSLYIPTNSIFFGSGSLSIPTNSLLP